MEYCLRVTIQQLFGPSTLRALRALLWNDDFKTYTLFIINLHSPPVPQKCDNPTFLREGVVVPTRINIFGVTLKYTKLLATIRITFFFRRFIQRQKYNDDFGCKLFVLLVKKRKLSDILKSSDTNGYFLLIFLLNPSKARNEFFWVPWPATQLMTTTQNQVSLPQY